MGIPIQIDFYKKLAPFMKGLILNLITNLPSTVAKFYR